MVEGEGFEPSKAEPSDLQSDPFGRSGTPPQVRGAYYQIRQLCEPLLVISGDKKVRGGHFLISFAHFSSLSTTSMPIPGMNTTRDPCRQALMGWAGLCMTPQHFLLKIWSHLVTVMVDRFTDGHCCCTILLSPCYSTVNMDCGLFYASSRYRRVARPVSRPQSTG